MLQSYKYGFLSLLRNRTTIFWTLAFPIILGTFFHIAFGSIVQNTESFSQIPTAIVIGENNDAGKYFLEMAESLSQGDDALLSPQYLSLEKAEQILREGKIDGIFHIKDDIRLIVTKQGLNQSVLKSISDSYMQISNTVSNIALSRPDMIEQTIANISKELQVNSEIYLGRGETDTFVHYYYVLMAMACMYGGYFGHIKMTGIQANMSPLAARRCISPKRKLSIIVSDIAAAVTLMFLESLVVIAYLTVILGVNFGEQLGFVVLTSLAGSIMGVSYGMFITSITKADNKAVEGILNAAILLPCFLSGLMLGNMKDIIEHYVPVVNRINPAAVLSDAFYCLTVYDTYSLYTQSIISLLIMSAVFCIVSSVVLRRKKYVNI